MVNGIASMADPCESCHRVPSAGFRFRANSGFIFMRRLRTFQGRLCRICARRVFRDMQAYNLTLGWWGFVSFVGTIMFLIENRRALMRGTAALRRPHPIDPHNDVKLAGRPVFARLPVVLVLAILVTFVFGLMTGSFGIDREQWAVGACVDYTEVSVIIIPCDGERSSEGQVLAIIDDVFGCPQGAQYFVEINREMIGCLGPPTSG